MNREEAVEAVADLYEITKEEAEIYYSDEIEAYQHLVSLKTFEDHNGQTDSN